MTANLLFRYFRLGCWVCLQVLFAKAPGDDTAQFLVVVVVVVVVVVFVVVVVVLAASGATFVVTAASIPSFLGY